ncbi:MAG TPA: hypothetical protein VFV41_16070 [Streptosporangiaceae bacterium]|nr:hypothetical protein [Streptosporangiaceae bacterium]
MKRGTERWHRPPRSGMAIFGMVAAVVLTIGGLVIVGAVVILFVGLSQYGSNK